MIRGIVIPRDNVSKEVIVTTLRQQMADGADRYLDIHVVFNTPPEPVPAEKKFNLTSFIADRRTVNLLDLTEELFGCIHKCIGGEGKKSKLQVRISAKHEDSDTFTTVTIKL